MIEIGIRELKSRLSYYVQLVQTGQTIAIKVRNRIVGFLSNITPKKGRHKEKNFIATNDLIKKINRWKNEGLLLSGGLCKPSRIHPVPIKGKETTADLLRKIREEKV